MKKTLISTFVLIAFFIMCFSAIAADESKMPIGGIHKIDWAWTSDATGFYQSGVSKTVIGYLIGAKFEPSATAAPTALYDVTIENGSGLDIILGVGANLPAGITDTGNIRTPLTTDGAYPFIWEEAVAPKVQNAGAAKQGTVILFIKY